MTVSAVKTIKIQNIVATTEIDQELDLKALTQDLPHGSYDPSSHPGIIYRVEKPKATVFLFRSGTVVGTGAKSIPDMQEALRFVSTTLRELNITVPEEPDIVIQNIVSSADLGYPLNLNAIAIGLGLENVEYEPEQFPGLVYRMEEPEVVMLLFGSGKLVITGGQTTDDAGDAVTTVRTQLEDLGLLQ
jgi:transcription initiation factor TFIID TATA-box-binding protein